MYFLGLWNMKEEQITSGFHPTYGKKHLFIHHIVFMEL